MLSTVAHRRRIAPSARRGDASRGPIDGAKLFAIVSVDASGLVTAWCPSAEKLFGYQRRDIVGKPFSSLHDAAGGEFARSDDLSLADRDGHSANAGWLVRKDGSSFYAIGHTTKLEPDGDGRPRGFVVIACDATDRLVPRASSFRVAV